MDAMKMWKAMLLVAALSVSSVCQGDTTIWSAGMESGNLLEWSYPNIPGSRGGQVQLVNTATAVASKEHARSGSWSVKTSIDNIQSGSAKVMMIRWKEPPTQRELFYSVWYYVPQVYTKKLTSPYGFFNWFEFVSGTSSHGPDPFFILGLENVNGGMRFTVTWNASDHMNVTGPLATDSGAKKVWATTASDIPIGRWFNVEARYVQASDFTGAIQIWQDGVEIFKLDNCRTQYPNSTFLSWQVNNYGLAITPSPVVIYMDDAAISTTRIAAAGY